MSLVTDITQIRPGMTVIALENNIAGTGFPRGHRTRVLSVEIRDNYPLIYVDSGPRNMATNTRGFYLYTHDFGRGFEVSDETLPENYSTEFEPVWASGTIVTDAAPLVTFNQIEEDRRTMALNVKDIIMSMKELK